VHLQGHPRLRRGERLNPHFLFVLAKRKRPFTVKRKAAWCKFAAKGLTFRLLWKSPACTQQRKHWLSTPAARSASLRAHAA